MNSIGFAVPALACDCHTHVFPDDSRFPFSSTRKYTPPFAGVAQLQAMLERLDLQRVVVVQPSVYGSDNAATLHAVHALGLARARAVAVIEDASTDAELDALHKAGVRGVRLNLEMLAESDPVRCEAIVRHTAAQIAGRGWHIQIYSQLKLVAALADVFGELDLPVVLDHFARASAQGGLAQPGLSVVLELVRAGCAYVKLSAPYLCSAAAPRHIDLDEIAHALVEANPQRMLWASNWPHPNPSHGPLAGPARVSQPQPVDDAEELGLLARWAPSAAVRNRILVDNPIALYGFDATITVASQPG